MLSQQTHYKTENMSQFCLSTQDGVHEEADWNLNEHTQKYTDWILVVPYGGSYFMR